MVNAEKHKRLNPEMESKELEEYHYITNHFYDNNLMFVHCLINNVLKGINKPTNAVGYNIDLEESIITDLVTEDKEKLSDLDLVKLELANNLIEQLKANNSLFNYKKPKARVQYEKDYYTKNFIILEELDTNENSLEESDNNERYTLIDILENVTDSSREFIIECLKEELAEIEEGAVN